MAHPFTPGVVTANDLFEGDAVYLTPELGWSREHGEAALAESAEEADALLAAGAAQTGRIVGAYLAEARKGADGRPEPVHFREAFRARGPSNRFHGKQAHREHLHREQVHRERAEQRETA